MTHHRKPHIVHVTCREGLSSAFMPQVVRPLSMVRDRGFDVSLVVFAPVGELIRRDLRERWHRRRREVQTKFGLPLTLLPSAPSRALNLWDDAVLLRAWLRLRADATAPNLLHCRGSQATHIALRTRRWRPDIPVICDCRGIDAPEFLMYRGVEDLAVAEPGVLAEYRQREALQRSAMEQADAVLCVSDAMRREFATRWNVPAARMRKVPCCTDIEAGRQAASRRQEMRMGLGLSDKFVISYSGSAAPWQMLPETFAAFRQIANLRADAHLLVLTTDKQILENAAANAGIPRNITTFMSVPHTEVPAHLAAADLGLLLRDTSVVNQVASPMKFAEYMSCGVPVVLTEGIGDFSDLVRSQRLGLVLPYLGSRHINGSRLAAFLSSYAVEPEQQRRRCLDAASNFLDWHDAIDVICEAYESLAPSGERAGTPTHVSTSARATNC